MKKTRGFTLLELLVVIAIIGILSAIILASLSSARNKAKDARRLADIHTIQTALELYRADHGGEYPSIGSQSTLSQCVAWAPSSGGYIPGLSPQYMSSLPTDPDMVASNNTCCYMYSSWATVGSFPSAYKFTIGKNCSNINFAAHPELADPTYDGGSDPSKVDYPNVNAITQWAIYSDSNIAPLP